MKLRFKKLPGAIFRDRREPAGRVSGMRRANPCFGYTFVSTYQGFFVFIDMDSVQGSCSLK
jgi:hypothetical protein